MPNSLQTDMNTAAQVYTDAFIEEVKGYLEALKAFSLDFSDAFLNRPGEAVPVPLVKADAAAPWNDSTNNFARQTATLKDALVIIDQHPIAGFGITREQLATFQPNYWLGKSAMNAGEIGRAVLTHVYSLVTADNFGDGATDKVTVALADFNKTTIAKLRAQLVKRKMIPAMTSIVLNPDFFAALLDGLDANVYGGTEAIRNGVIPGMFGFNSIIEAPTYTGGPGFACHPAAIAVASRKLLPVSLEPYEVFETFQDEATGMVFNNVVYADGATGAASMSVECNFGAGVGDPKALVRLVG